MNPPMFKAGLAIFFSAAVTVAASSPTKCLSHLSALQMGTWHYNKPVTPENLVEAQSVELLAFRSQFLPLMDGKNPYRKLPSGIPFHLQEPLEALLRLTRDGEMVFRLLQDFERMVVHYAHQKKVPLAVAFDPVLKGYEHIYGLTEPVEVRDFLSQEKFMELLAAGNPVDDLYWEGKAHTRHGHRLYSMLEARYIHTLFGSKEMYLALYMYMGDRNAMLSDWSWEGTGISMKEINPNDSKTLPDIWAILHDTSFFVHPGHSLTGERAAHDFSNPEFFGDLRLYTPGLVGWH